jgi:hypothetical protein
MLGDPFDENTRFPHIPDRLPVFLGEPLPHLHTSRSTNSMFANQAGVALTG